MSDNDEQEKTESSCNLEDENQTNMEHTFEREQLWEEPTKQGKDNETKTGENSESTVVVREKLKQVLRSMVLMRTFSVNLTDIAIELYQACIISQEVKESPSYDAIIESFLVGLNWNYALTDLEIYCNKFLQALSNVGGPVADAAEVIQEEWIETVRDELGIELQLDYLHQPFKVKGIKDYSALLDDALKYGYIYIKWSKFSLSGPPGSGKSSFMDLLQGKEPCLIHQSTPVAANAEVRIVETSSLIKTEGASETAWKKIDTKLLRNMIAEEINKHEMKRKYNLTSSVEDNSSSLSILSSKPANELANEPPANEPPAANESADESIDMDVNHDASDDVETLVNSNAQSQIINYMYNKTDDSTALALSEVQFIYGVDSGGQAAFLDIAPALLRYKSVNILTHKLDESLNDPAKFFFCDENGKRVGEPIQRKETHLQLLQMSLHSSTSISPSVLKYIEDVTEGGSSKPLFIVLGTFFDAMKKESLSEKNIILWDKLESFVTAHHTLMCYEESNKDIIFPIRTTDRGVIAKAVAAEIRSLIQKHYIKAKVPLRWFLFQLELESHKEAHGILSKRLCDQIGLRSAQMSSEEVTAALLYYHDLTIFLYFSEIEVVFLRPQPLFDMLSKLIEVSFENVAVGDVYTGNLTTNLKEFGKFDKELLQSIDSYFSHEFSADQFLTIMQSLLIIAPSAHEEGSYFLPCVLPTCDDSQLEQLTRPFLSHCDKLILTWRNISSDRITLHQLPQGLFPALVVKLLEEKNYKFQLLKHDAEQPYRNVIKLLSIRIAVHILLVDNLEQLEVYSSGKHSIVRYLVRDAIESVINKIHYSEYSSFELDDAFVCSNNPTHICIPSEDKEMISCINGCFPTNITERQQLWLIDITPPISNSTFESNIAHKVPIECSLSIKESQVELNYLADKLLGKGIITKAKRRAVSDTMTGRTTDERMDMLLDELSSTVKIDGSIFGWFIQVLREYGTIRSKDFAQKLLNKYTDLSGGF